MVSKDPFLRYRTSGNVDHMQHTHITVAQHQVALTLEILKHAQQSTANTEHMISAVAVSLTLAVFARINGGARSHPQFSGHKADQLDCHM